MAINLPFSVSLTQISLFQTQPKTTAWPDLATVNKNADQKSALASALKQGDKNAIAVIRNALNDVNEQNTQALTTFFGDVTVSRKVMKGVMTGTLQNADVLNFLQKKQSLVVGEQADVLSVWKQKSGYLQSIASQQPKAASLALKFVKGSDGKSLLSQDQQLEFARLFTPKQSYFSALSGKSVAATISSAAQEALADCLPQFNDVVKKEIAIELINNGAALENSSLNGARSFG